jgi:hypothetical protein
MGGSAGQRRAVATAAAINAGEAGWPHSSQCKGRLTRASRLREGASDGGLVPSPPYTRIVDLAFPPGVPQERPGPLARFLPPLERGAVTRFLAGYPFPEGWLLDPFGSSPLLAIEAAQSRGVVAAVSNAVTRFVLECRIDPLSPADLRAALAQLAAAPKDETRLERFLLELYRSECARCGAPITADHFIWDRELQVPVLKAYACDACHHSGEDPTTPADRERAVASPGYALAHALAAERAAAADDPDGTTWRRPCGLPGPSRVRAGDPAPETRADRVDARPEARSGRSLALDLRCRQRALGVSGESGAPQSADGLASVSRGERLESPRARPRRMAARIARGSARHLAGIGAPRPGCWPCSQVRFGISPKRSRRKRRPS